MKVTGVTVTGVTRLGVYTNKQIIVFLSLSDAKKGPARKLIS